MLASERWGNVAPNHLYFKRKASSCIRDKPRCSSSAPDSEPDTRHGADMSWTLLILIRESIKFYCGNSDSDLKLLTIGTLCADRMSPLWRWLEKHREKRDSLNNLNRKSTWVTKIWLALEKLTRCCWYCSSLLLWTSCLAWGLTENTSHRSDKAKTANDLNSNNST